MTEDDIDFRGVLTDAAAAGFAGGEFDCVGVFAPFTLHGPGAARVATSCSTAPTSPAPSPDHIVVTPELIEERPEDVQALVDAWYATLDYIEANPEEALEIMADVAEADAGGVRGASPPAPRSSPPRRRWPPSRTATTPPRSSTRPS